MTDKILIQNKQSWDTMADSWFGTTGLLTTGKNYIIIID